LQPADLVVVGGIVHPVMLRPWVPLDHCTCACS